MEYQAEIEEIVNDLQDEIVEKLSQIDLLRNIDWESPVDEKTWHKICETTARTSDLMGKLLKNIFPSATDVKVHANYVYFTMHGFQCALPTWDRNGICISTAWYQPKKEPVFRERPENLYFREKAGQARWNVMFDLRFPKKKNHPRWVKYISWHCFYRWKDDHQDVWEEVFRKDCQEYERRLTEYQQQRQLMHDKAKTLFQKVLPELKHFSTEYFKFENDPYTFEKIANLENLPWNMHISTESEEKEDFMQLKREAARLVALLDAAEQEEMDR